MNVLRVDVPCKSKNISSLLKTKLSSFGNTPIMILNYSDCLSLVFFKSVLNSSRTCCRMEESIKFKGFCSDADLSAERSIVF